MKKEYTALGLMSGTSGDGVDASIIQSDGNNSFKLIKDIYIEYDSEIYNNIHKLREKINFKIDLQKYSKDILQLEKQITIFHAKIIKDLNEFNKIELIGFHGQTIYHNGEEKVSKQLGDGLLLSQLIKKEVVYNFRQNDIKNGGEGAPLTPIFHKLIASQYNFGFPVCILNIGGISNISFIENSNGKLGVTSKDIGPGNCLIDNWVRKNSNKKYDKDGRLAAHGTVNEIILEQGQELFANKPKRDNITYDINDFDVSFVRGLTLSDGAATLTEFTAKVISSSLDSIFLEKKLKLLKVLVCGGGRKNHTLISKIKNYCLKDLNILSIDDYGIKGDFVESQAFGYLAIRSKLNFPISFPETTGCNKPSTGGELVKF